MTFWIEKIVSNQDSIRLQKMFEKQFMELGGPRAMLVVSVDDVAAGTSRMFAGFPNDQLLGLYDGFASIRDDQLPKKAAFLVGHKADFAERFSVPDYR